MQSIRRINKVKIVSVLLIRGSILILTTRWHTLFAENNEQWMIQETLLDQEGRPYPQLPVTLLDESQEQTLMINQTDDDGLVHFENLEEKIYKLRIDADQIQNGLQGDDWTYIPSEIKISPSETPSLTVSDETITPEAIENNTEALSYYEKIVTSTLVPSISPASIDISENDYSMTETITTENYNLSTLKTALDTKLAGLYSSLTTDSSFLEKYPSKVDFTSDNIVAKGDIVGNYLPGTKGNILLVIDSNTATTISNDSPTAPILGLLNGSERTIGAAFSNLSIDVLLSNGSGLVLKTGKYGSSISENYNYYYIRNTYVHDGSNVKQIVSYGSKTNDIIIGNNVTIQPKRMGNTYYDIVGVGITNQQPNSSGSTIASIGNISMGDNVTINGERGDGTFLPVGLGDYFSFSATSGTTGEIGDVTIGHNFHIINTSNAFIRVVYATMKSLTVGDDAQLKITNENMKITRDILSDFVVLVVPSNIVFGNNLQVNLPPNLINASTGKQNTYSAGIRGKNINIGDNFNMYLPFNTTAVLGTNITIGNDATIDINDKMNSEILSSSNNGALIIGDRFHFAIRQLSYGSPNTLIGSKSAGMIQIGDNAIIEAKVKTGGDPSKTVFSSIIGDAPIINIGDDLSIQTDFYTRAVIGSYPDRSDYGFVTKKLNQITIGDNANIQGPSFDVIVGTYADAIIIGTDTSSPVEITIGKNFSVEASTFIQTGVGITMPQTPTYTSTYFINNYILTTIPQINTSSIRFRAGEGFYLKAPQVGNVYSFETRYTDRNSKTKYGNFNVNFDVSSTTVVADTIDHYVYAASKKMDDSNVLRDITFTQSGDVFIIAKEVKNNTIADMSNGSNAQNPYTITNGNLLQIVDETVISSLTFHQQPVNSSGVPLQWYALNGATNKEPVTLTVPYTYKMNFPKEAYKDATDKPFLYAWLPEVGATTVEYAPTQSGSLVISPGNNEVKATLNTPIIFNDDTIITITDENGQEVKQFDISDTNDYTIVGNTFILNEPALFLDPNVRYTITIQKAGSEAIHGLGEDTNALVRFVQPLTADLQWNFKIKESPKDYDFHISYYFWRQEDMFLAKTVTHRTTDNGLPLDVIKIALSAGSDWRYGGLPSGYATEDVDIQSTLIDDANHTVTVIYNPVRIPYTVKYYTETTEDNHFIASKGLKSSSVYINNTVMTSILNDYNPNDTLYEAGLWVDANGKPMTDTDITWNPEWNILYVVYQLRAPITTPAPSETTTSSVPTTSSPSETMTSSTPTTSSPSETTTSSVPTTSSPSETTTSSVPTTSSPSETMTSSVPTTSSPSETMTSSTPTTSSPSETMTSSTPTTSSETTTKTRPTVPSSTDPTTSTAPSGSSSAEPSASTAPSGSSSAEPSSAPRSGETTTPVSTGSSETTSAAPVVPSMAPTITLVPTEQSSKGLIPTEIEGVYTVIDENGVPLGYVSPTTNENGETVWIDVDSDGTPLGSTNEFLNEAVPNMTTKKENPKTVDNPLLQRGLLLSVFVGITCFPFILKRRPH